MKCHSINSDCQNNINMTKHFKFKDLVIGHYNFSLSSTKLLPDFQGAASPLQRHDGISGGRTHFAGHALDHHQAATLSPANKTTNSLNIKADYEHTIQTYLFFINPNDNCMPTLNDK